MEASNSDIVIVHPNRQGAEAQATKGAVILLLVASAVITAIVTFGGWSKLEGAQQELDESDLWLELLSEANVVKAALIAPLREETNELIAIFVTMTKNVKRRR